MEGLFLLKNIDLFAFSLSLQYPEIHQHYFRIEVNRKALIKLAKIGWFPGLGLPLDNLQEILRTVSADRDRAEKIAIDFLRERVDAIELELSQSYPERSHLFRDAFQAHRERKYNLAIPVLLAQSDGIFWEASSPE